VNAGVWVALISAAVTAIVAGGGWLVERRKRLAETARLAAETESVRRAADAAYMDAVGRVATLIQDRYQELLADITAQANTATARCAQAEISARTAQASAAESEAQAWQAQQHARQMARFLVELRPVIAAHVPEVEAAPLLERMDRLTSLV
jgi:hypothetical protein